MNDVTWIEIFTGLGVGLALLIVAVVVAFLPWRLRSPRRHGVTGGGDHATGEHHGGGGFSDGGGSD